MQEEADVEAQPEDEDDMLECVFKIKAGSQIRKIPLREIEEIHAGMEPPDIDTPLDDLCATLALASTECISFRLPDIAARDTFVMCMLMFANAQH